ncbi:hypothetical protein ALT785_580047 [Alteromonas infernus]
MVIPFYLSSLRQIEFEVNTSKHSKATGICFVLSFIIEFVKKSKKATTGLMRQKEPVMRCKAFDLLTVNK